MWGKWLLDNLTRNGATLLPHQLQLPQVQEPVTNSNLVEQEELFFYKITLTSCLEPGTFSASSEQPEHFSIGIYKSRPN